MASRNAGDDVYGVQFGQRRAHQTTLKDGAIDEMRVYSKALTPVEVRVLHSRRSLRPRTAALSGRKLMSFSSAQDEKVAEALNTLTAARNIENEIGVAAAGDHGDG